MSVMYITKQRVHFSGYAFGRRLAIALSDQPIAFAGCLVEAQPIEDRDLPSAALNGAGPFLR
jgi:hypothetical protein